MFIWSREKQYMDILDSPLPYDQIDQYTLAARTQKYMRANPRDGWATVYRQWLQHDSRDRGRTDRRPSRSHPFGLSKSQTKEAAANQLRKAVFNGTRLLTCTTYVSGTLEDFYDIADIVVLDEAAQASEPDAIRALGPQVDLELSIMAGDTRQIGRVESNIRWQSITGRHSIIQLE